MAIKINRAENWEAVYQAFTQINFTAWDFDSVKKSLLDYLKLYYPEESFNDYIESSEFIAQIELFAYIAELFAYRLDMNAHETMFKHANRKESILRAVKLISYNSSRNIPSRGLVKLTSVSTTEALFDSNGTSLSNKQIYWNDLNNPRWKNHFLLIMNTILSQPFGTVLPTDTVSVQDILFELYSLKNEYIPNNVLKYNINISSTSYPMELVSSSLDTYGPFETRPEHGLHLNLLYTSDGLGDSSDNTGFFFLTKQGTLTNETIIFDGATPNQTHDIIINNINNIDVWLNQIDPTTLNTITGTFTNKTKNGYWFEVDVSNGQNIVFNTSTNMNKFEVETLNNDNIRLIFGDGNFSNIPGGTFQAWYRTSANKTLVIPKTAVQNVTSSMTYIDMFGQKQTFSFSFSLQDSIQNAAPSETIEHIKDVATSHYYTQNRMTNGKDYNVFMLQDNSILKLQAINRTFSGDSKYIKWHDPSGYYDNVKLFTDDGVVYFDDYIINRRVNPSELPVPDYTTNITYAKGLIDNILIPIFKTIEFSIKAVLEGGMPTAIRTELNTSEIIELTTLISQTINNPPNTFWMEFVSKNNNWIIYTSKPTTPWIRLEYQTNGYWDIKFFARRIIVHSTNLQFWSASLKKTINYDTLNSEYDEIVILSANMRPDKTILGTNKKLNVISQLPIINGPNNGINSIHDLVTIPSDANGNGVPVDVTLPYLIGAIDFVYFHRSSITSNWEFVPYTTDVLSSWELDQTNGSNLWRRLNGVEKINIAWFHRAPTHNLIDPAQTNIIDSYIITRGYYTNLKEWLDGNIVNIPVPPSSLQLRNDYGKLLESKMISDTVILHSGKIKIIIGNKAPQTLQAVIQVILSAGTILTSNQIKVNIVNLIKSYFDINNWQFGKSFYFTDMASYIHNNMVGQINSIVLIPKFNSNIFGDLFKVECLENEIIQPSISVDDIQIVSSLNPSVLSNF